MWRGESARLGGEGRSGGLDVRRGNVVGNLEFLGRGVEECRLFWSKARIFGVTCPTSVAV